MNDDWKGWKNGKYDKRYRGVKRHSGKRNYWKIVAIIMPISAIMILLAVIPIQGFNALTSFMSHRQTVSNSMQSDVLKTMSNNILTEDNYFAQLVPSNIKVVDKDRYNVISLTVTVNVKNLPIDGSVYFEDLYTTLKDENSKEYKPDPAECEMNDLIPIIGKQTDSTAYTVCYSVDKTHNKFSILYTEPQFNYHATRIGHISLDSNLFSYYDAHRNPQPIPIGTIDLTKQ